MLRKAPLDKGRKIVEWESDGAELGLSEAQ